MADLVIKPSSGNLVLKDDQNVARLTLATSSGNTTFTGATTLANATITAGTFPAGMILQVVSDNYNTEVETGGTKTKCCEVTLVAKQANSKFYYQSCISVGGEGDADNIYIDVSKTAGTSAVVTDDLPADNLTPSSGTRSGKQYQSDNADIYQFSMNSVNLSDLVVSTHSVGANITFGLWVGGGCYVNRSWGREGTEAGITTLTVMEIGV